MILPLHVGVHQRTDQMNCSVPCQNGECLSSTAGVSTCRCYEGFSGPACETSERPVLSKLLNLLQLFSEVGASQLVQVLERGGSLDTS